MGARPLICFFASLVTGSILSGCELDHIQEPVDLTFSDILRSINYQMEREYIFWDIDSEYWDENYNLLFEKFQDFDISDDRNWLQFKDELKALSVGLNDKHFQVRFNEGPLAGSSISSVENFDTSVTSAFSLVENYVISDLEDLSYVSDNTISRVLFGKIDSTTALLKVSNFSFQRILKSSIDAEPQQFFDRFREIYVANQTQTLILDLRNCLGGDLIDLRFFLSMIISQRINLGFSRERIGNARTAYGPWISSVFDGSPSSFETKQLICLIDRQTYSMAEIISIVIKENSLGRIVGERSGGALSPVSNSDLFGGGDLIHKSVYQITLSSVQYMSPMKNRFDGTGITPDHIVYSDSVSSKMGIDSQLEAAIKIAKIDS